MTIRSCAGLTPGDHNLPGVLTDGYDVAFLVTGLKPSQSCLSLHKPFCPLQEVSYCWHHMVWLQLLSKIANKIDTAGRGKALGQADCLHALAGSGLDITLPTRTGQGEGHVGQVVLPVTVEGSVEQGNTLLHTGRCLISLRPPELG